MLLADKNIIVHLIEQGQVVIPTAPMFKSSRPFYWILLKEANLYRLPLLISQATEFVICISIYIRDSAPSQLLSNLKVEDKTIDYSI